jgi:glycosyltransferase 2 family protein
MQNTPYTTPPPIDSDGQQILSSLRPSRVLLPIALGLIAVGYLFYAQFDIEQISNIQWTGQAFAWMALALGLLVLCHCSYALRLFTLTGGAFSWRKCLQLMVLWEFSAALTPTNKGGPFVMLFVLTREKLAAGRTAAAVFYAIVCDAGFFVLSLPILLSLYGPAMLYPGANTFSEVWVASGVFFSTYAFMLSYWIVLVVFLFIRPQYARNTLSWLSRRAWIQKYAPKLERLGSEFALAAQEVRHQPSQYHLKVIAGTVGAWTFKFLMINCLLMAIVPTTSLDGSTQAFVYARMVAMFIIMAAAPTPGGAGVAELLFAALIADFVPEPGIAMVIALIWRGMAYYGYLLLGAIVVPSWVAKQLNKGKTSLRRDSLARVD